MVEFQQIAAALYLAAGVGALLGVALGKPRMEKGAVDRVGGRRDRPDCMAFATLHRLSELAAGNRSCPWRSRSQSWIGVLFLLALMWRLRIPALTGAVGPVAFLAVFVASMRLSTPGSPGFETSGSWPHLHVLLASAGLGLLGRRRRRGALLPARAPPPEAEAQGRGGLSHALARGARSRERGVARGRVSAPDAGSRDRRAVAARRLRRALAGQQPRDLDRCRVGDLRRA